MKILVVLASMIYLCVCSPLDNTTLHCTGDCLKADENALMNKVMPLKIKEHEECVRRHECPTKAKKILNAPCENGVAAGEFKCKNVDLLAFIPLAELGSEGDGNDIWGWTDPETKKEYAIVCAVDGTSFVDITEPQNPTVLGFLKTHTSSSLWRDAKVVNDHAFIVSEAFNHGMQVFDLRRLRDIIPESPVKNLEADAHYDEFGSAHNIVANEDSDFVYVVGSRTCRGGLHMINVKDPTNPKYAGCFEEDGYVHDAQCVIYKGPDPDHQGKEICFCYNEDTLTIVDVTVKTVPKYISRMPYDDNQYTHQGWLNEEQTHLLLNDELDELRGLKTRHTRTMIWDVMDLDTPHMTGQFYSSRTAVDHNLYIRGKLAYEANYSAGLRILDISEIADLEEPKLEEVGYFELDPDNCNDEKCEVQFSGAWSSYVYFASNTIIVNSIERGLFVLKYSPQPAEE